MDVVLLTHGAGSNRDAPKLVAFERAFAARGFFARRFDLPFRKARPSGPPTRADRERDLLGVAAEVEAARAAAPKGARVFLGGHSYGGRLSSMVAAAGTTRIDGLLLLSYPLHPPRKPNLPRTAHFGDLRTRALFVHGSRDPFGSPEELRDALGAIPSRREPYWVDGAGHDLIARRRAGGAKGGATPCDADSDHDALAAAAAEAFMEFMEDRPVFGERTHGVVYADRPGAYVVARDERGRVALVDTPKGVFLPGGGIDPGETPLAAAARETLEETGFEGAFDPPAHEAIQYVRRVEEGVAYRKASTFLRGRLLSKKADGESDHRLLFLDPDAAARAASHGSHADAIARLCGPKLV
jgi:uncharacterized protein